MIALVIGGAASGKSACAEQLACGLSEQRTYLATMAPASREAAARIAKHRAQRAHAGFETIELIGTLAGVAPTSHTRDGVALLDDVGNLVSCALFDDNGPIDDAASVVARLLREFDELVRCFAHVVVVGNQVGCDGQRFVDQSMQWVRAVGELCCGIAARCDQVVEVVAGQPCSIKGVPQIVQGSLPGQGVRL